LSFRNRAFLLDLPELGQPADAFLSRVFAVLVFITFRIRISYDTGIGLQ
jgi:hypothetical protein